MAQELWHEWRPRYGCHSRLRKKVSPQTGRHVLVLIAAFNVLGSILWYSHCMFALPGLLLLCWLGRLGPAGLIRPVSRFWNFSGHLWPSLLVGWFAGRCAVLLLCPRPRRFAGPVGPGFVLGEAKPASLAWAMPAGPAWACWVVYTLVLLLIHRDARVQPTLFCA